MSLKNSSILHTNHILVSQGFLSYTKAVLWLKEVENNFLEQPGFWWKMAKIWLKVENSTPKNRVKMVSNLKKKAYSKPYL